MSVENGPRPLIEFPCPDYPIKVLGDAFVEFEKEVLAVLLKHADICGKPAPLNASRNGRFSSLTVKIVATGEPQLKRLHAELKDLSFVKMVL
ncbi:YbeD family protein [Marinagarivorans algicola]|uniref:YbeD family protein n=1 Tax=Marinagarivorans algicola TaxID=1513270 RepID=UPI0006B58AE7|nr:DUF493 family protein [Marinagarivorans algicola]